MGTVYEVLDHASGAKRALKRLLPNAEAVAVRAFEREYQVLASLRHPRIIRVFEYGVDEIGPYYTMELVGGEDLRGLAPLEFRTACGYLRDVAASLALLHARRLLHRDVTPRNVRATGDGHCTLLDFGALTGFGRPATVIGTPAMVPPEALQGVPLDQRSDLYSLGAVAYWLLTRRHAYPARDFADLPRLWTQRPLAPSTFASDVPPELDALVLSLLEVDPLARPASAAEVMARLSVAGDLGQDDTSGDDLLAQSFLLNPRFMGREVETEGIRASIAEAVSGHGGAVCIEAGKGMGRTRFLEEVSVRAQLMGATVLGVDASMYRHLHGTVRALVHGLFDAAPAVASAHAGRYRAALSALGPDIEARLGAQTSRPPSQSPIDLPGGRPDTSLDGWFLDVSRDRPLAIVVDNVDDADHGSQGLLAALAKAVAANPFFIAVTQEARPEVVPSFGLRAIRARAKIYTLSGLSDGEVLELVRSLFGDAPGAQRFADWLHERTAGSPLHAVEICRQLVARDVVRFSGGVWTLPLHAPEAELPLALDDALSQRLDGVSEAARSLAECLSLQREQPTLDLCRLLLHPSDDEYVLGLLDELARNDVLHGVPGGYRFSSNALREALLRDMDDVREEQNHGRLGDAFVVLASDRAPVLQTQAGFHYIRGGQEARGADLIAQVASQSATIRTLMANLHRMGAPLEAALRVYRRQRRSIYETMPLLAALAQAGYYEERAWGDTYGDEALNVLEDICGLRSAKRLRPYVGGVIALVAGMVFATMRFYFTSRKERSYSFGQALVHLMTTVTTLAGAASLSLDPERATRVADTLQPFDVLPARLTPVGIYQFCRALQEIGRDNEVQAYAAFDVLLHRFEDPRYYPTLPPDARKLYIAAAHFTRGTFAVFRTDGRGALESAAALDGAGLRLYEMIASQLRFLYFMNRGEFEAAEVHRQEVELAAAQVGSVWQVETWEAPALILVYTLLGDIVPATRVAHRLETMSREVPSLRRYSRLAKQGLLLARGESVRYTELVASEYAHHEPRSYIGWAATMAYLIQAYNAQGRFAEARAFGDEILRHTTDGDRDYSSLFLNLDLQVAMADAGLGRVEAAFARVDGLLTRFEGIEHPIAMGLLHETRARIAMAAGRSADFERSLLETERWLRSTNTPALVARHEQLVRFRDRASVGRAVPREAERDQTQDALADEGETVIGTQPGPGIGKGDPESHQ